MSEIKRYRPAMRNFGEGPQVSMREDSAGEYAEWTQILSLEARVAELEQQLAGLLSTLEQIAAHAHHGGLLEGDSDKQIRALSLPYWKADEYKRLLLANAAVREVRDEM